MGRPRLGVLGPLQVLGPDGAALPLGGQKPRELLAVLLLHRGRPLPPERLVHALWGEGASDGAAITLRTHVSSVRRILSAAGLTDALQTAAGGYVLTLVPSDVDVEVFERLVAYGQEALGLGDAQTARATLDEALALWRGQPLADVDHLEIASTEVPRLEELKVVAEEALMSAELAVGHHGEAVGRLQGLVAAHPFRERLAAQLMLALYRSGRQAEALSVYAATKQRLGDELGLDPGPELRELETAMLRHDPMLLGTASHASAADGATGAHRRVSRRPDAVMTALRRTAMVGRSAELRTLEQRWSSVLDGDVGAALVSGPAGVGKSRLVAELAHRAGGAGAAVLVGRCDEASLPYQPLATALRDSPDVADVLRRAPEPVRHRLRPLLPADSTDAPGGADETQLAEFLGAVEWLVTAVAARTPVLLLIEDSDRLDAATAVVLRHLSRHLPARCMLVIAYRDPPGSRHPPLQQLLGDAGMGALAERLVLRALPVGDLTTLVAAVTGTEPHADFVETLWARTGGNPFFATEVLRDLGPTRTGGPPQLDGSLPAGIRDVLRHRLLTLPQDTRDTVGAAAVLGPEAELVLLARVLGQPEDHLVRALEPAVAAGFLVEAGGSWAGAYAFPHDLMREAVYAELGPLRRERLHRRAADALLSAAVLLDADLIAAAVHLRLAGAAADPRTAGEVSLRASELAARGLAWDEALQHGEAALPLLDRGVAPEEQAAARVRVAMLRLRSGRDYARAVTLLDEALSRQLAAGDARAAGVVHSRIGGALTLHHSIMDIPRALDHFDAAERLLPDAEDVFHLHRGRMQAAMHGLRLDVLEKSVQQAQALAARTGRGDLSAFAGWGAAYLAVNRGDPAQAFRHLEDAWRAAHLLGDPYLGWPPANAAAHIATELLLDPVTGRSWCRRALGQPRFLAFSQPHEAVADQLARAMAAMGELDAAARASAALPQDAISRRVLGFLDGSWEQTVTDCSTSLARDESAGDRHDALFQSRLLVVALVKLQQGTRATRVLRNALQVAANAPQAPSEAWLRAQLAQLVVATAPVEAASHVRRCEELVAGGEEWAGLRGEVALARAVVSGNHGRLGEAESALEEALAIFAAHQLPWRQAETHLAWARLHDEAEDRTEAGVQRARARTLYKELGAAERWVQACADVRGVAEETSTRRQRLDTRVES